jgi:hypothetical protein
MSESQYLAFQNLSSIQADEIWLNGKLITNLQTVSPQRVNIQSDYPYQQIPNNSPINEGSYIQTISSKDGSFSLWEESPAPAPSTRVSLGTERRVVWG